MARGPSIGLAGLSLTLLAACGGSQPKVRVVLITLDTLRWSGWQGVDQDSPMPRTVLRLERGLCFDNAWAATSTTQPTHASLLTGLHPWEHGVTRNGLVLGPERETLPERLRAAGFETRAVVASFPLGSAFGFEQGFATFDQTFELELELADQATWNRAEVQGNAFYSLAGDVTRRAIAQIDAASAARQFFWFHYFDPHDPYGDAVGEDTLDVGDLRKAAARKSARLDADLRRARALYLKDLDALDGSLDALLARLQRDEREFETHVVITSDHGESFGEDGSVGHGTRVTRAQLHVPLGILSPRVARGVRTDACGSIDVHATLLDLAGLEVPAASARSLLAPPPADGGAAFGMRRTYDDPLEEVRVDGSSVPVDGRRFFAVVDGVLYAGRPGAIVSEDGGAPPVDGELAAALGARFETFEAALQRVRAEERGDETTLEALRALGYTR